MAGRLIPFVPPAHSDPAQLLRISRERCGLSLREFAPRVGRAIGRPDLTAGALRAWEDGAVHAPRSILEAAAAIARGAPRAHASIVHEAPAAQPPSLDDIHAALRALDGSYGRATSTSLLPAASQHLGQIATIRGTRRASSIRRDLDAREADAAMLMGQLVWDASQRRDHDTARLYFDQAISAARRAGDPVATAHGLLRNGYIALWHSARLHSSRWCRPTKRLRSRTRSATRSAHARGFRALPPIAPSSVTGRSTARPFSSRASSVAWVNGGAACGAGRRDGDRHGPAQHRSRSGR